MFGNAKSNRAAMALTNADEPQRSRSRSAPSAAMARAADRRRTRTRRSPSMPQTRGRCRSRSPSGGQKSKSRSPSVANKPRVQRPFTDFLLRRQDRAGAPIRVPSGSPPRTDALDTPAKNETMRSWRFDKNALVNMLTSKVKGFELDDGRSKADAELVMTNLMTSLAENKEVGQMGCAEIIANATMAKLALHEYVVVVVHSLKFGVDLAASRANYVVDVDPINNHPWADHPFHTPHTRQSPLGCLSSHLRRRQRRRRQ